MNALLQQALQLDTTPLRRVSRAPWPAVTAAEQEPSPGQTPGHAARQPGPAGGAAAATAARKAVSERHSSRLLHRQRSRTKPSPLLMAEGEAPVDDRGANVYSDLFTGARPVLPRLQRTAPLPSASSRRRP